MKRNNRQCERGSAVAALPILLLGGFVFVGAFQLTLFMSGQHMADLGAYRASRILQETPVSSPKTREEARREAERVCRIGYPDTLSQPTVNASLPAPKVSVKLEMEPVLPLPFLSQRASTANAVYPPLLPNLVKE